ncbi:MAG: LysR substrate-binding domain-containing protein [Alphaproteobacteria bacterium]|nr:LysR substrate-binding domain-containing protein [Alphaproteobacteria bacterium]
MLMARALPPVAWFRAFESAARHLSFTAAAEELGLTQSAISQNVRSLELRFSTILFERKPRGLALTDAGRRLLPDVTAAMGSLSNAAGIFERASDSGLLTVAASVSFAQWYFVPGLSRLMDANPTLSLRVITTVWPDEFSRSSADVELRFGTESHMGKGAEHLGPDELIVVAAPDLMKRVGQPFLSTESLRQQRLIQAVGTSDNWKRWAQHSRIASLPEPDLMADSHGLVIDFARAGLGVGVTSALLAAPSLASGDLVQAHAMTAPTKDGYFLATNPLADQQDVDLFTTWLKAEISAATTQADLKRRAADP